MSNNIKFQDGGLTYRVGSCKPLENAAHQGQLSLSAIGRYDYPGTQIPVDCLDKICSIGCWDANHQQNWGLEFHRNEGVEITFLERGSLYFATDDEEYELLPGYVTITRPWQKHRVGNPNVSSSMLHWLILDVEVRQPHSEWKWPEWFVLSEKDLKSLTDLMRYNEEPVWMGNKEILVCFQKIKQYIEDPDVIGNENRLKLYINELFLLLLEMLSKSSTKSDKSLTSVHHTVNLFIRELPEVLDMDWTLDKMASHCKLKRSQFSTYFTQITNHSPINYLNELRLNKAVQLLEGSNQSISQIAFECGYNTSQYFAVQFRKKYGTSPVNYRKKMVVA